MTTTEVARQRPALGTLGAVDIAVSAVASLFSVLGASIIGRILFVDAFLDGCQHTRCVPESAVSVIAWAVPIMLLVLATGAAGMVIAILRRWPLWPIALATLTLQFVACTVIWSEYTGNGGVNP